MRVKPSIMVDAERILLEQSNAGARYQTESMALDDCALGPTERREDMHINIVPSPPQTPKLAIVLMSN
jgi:hypothetical protein